MQEGTIYNTTFIIPVSGNNYGGNNNKGGGVWICQLLHATISLCYVITSNTLIVLAITSNTILVRYIAIHISLNKNPDIYFLLSTQDLTFAQQEGCNVYKLCLVM